MAQNLCVAREKRMFKIFPHLSQAIDVAVNQGKARDRSSLVNDAISCYLREKLGMRTGKTVVLVEQEVEVQL